MEMCLQVEVLLSSFKQKKKGVLTLTDKKMTDLTCFFKMELTP